MSDDGNCALTIIAFQGSVFSPYYAWSGRGDPLDHCAVNVALYGPKRQYWTMTERGRGAIERSRDQFTVGPSGLNWDGTALTIRFDETTPGFPLPIKHRLRGRVRIEPKTFTARAFELDPQGRHVWWPIAPTARIELELEEPSIRWRGEGYVDSNRGAEPLEAGFVQWDWCRAPLENGAVVLYDVDSRRGPVEPLAIRFNDKGDIEPLERAELVRLPRTPWQVPRTIRSEAGGARVRKTLEDSPFYSRSLIETRLAGERVTAIHESLSLNRFANPIVKRMLTYKMPRVV